MSFVDTLFEGLEEQSKLKIMEELRRFEVEVRSRKAVKIGDLENLEATKVAGTENCSQTERSSKGRIATSK